MKNNFDFEGTVQFNAEKFIESSYPIEKVNLTSLRCIDDREERQPNSSEQLPNYAVPGAGLGITLDTIAAVRALSQEHNATGPASEAIFAAVEKALDGIISFHTDKMHDDDLACAGCGYCAASLKKPEDNFLPVDDAEFITSQALPQTVQKLQEKNIPVASYDGPHVAKAVMIVEGEHIGLPSASASGDHAFVYHKDIRDQLLRNAADSTYSLLTSITSADSLSKEQWREKVIETADKRLKIVLKQLAEGLPMFIVKQEDGNTTVVAV